MKLFLIAAALTLSTNAFAVEKVCFGLKSDDTTKGTSLKATITKSKVVVADGDNAGSYPRFKGKGGKVEGKDGVTYLDYSMDGGDGCSELLVDESLVTEEGKGQLKFRCRGEGFGDNKYFCRNEGDKEDK